MDVDVVFGDILDDALVPPSLRPRDASLGVHLRAQVELLPLPKTPDAEVPDLSSYVRLSFAVLDDLQRGRALGVSHPALQAAVFDKDLVWVLTM